MFEQYLDLKGFVRMGTSDVVDVSISITEHGSFNTSRVFYSLEKADERIVNIEVFFSPHEQVLCLVVEKEQNQGGRDYRCPSEIIKSIGLIIRPIIEESLPKLEKRQKYTIPGKAYISEGKAFFNLADAVRTNLRKGKGKSNG